MDQIENTLYAYLTIRGDLVDPEYITNELQIVPTTKFRKGDLWGSNNQKFRKFGLWDLSTDNSVFSNSLEEHINWILEKIEPSRTNFLKLSSRSDILIDITCVFHMYGMEHGGDISVNLIRRLADLNISLGISLYFLGYEEKSS